MLYDPIYLKCLEWTYYKDKKISGCLGPWEYVPRVYWG